MKLLLPMLLMLPACIILFADNVRLRRWLRARIKEDAQRTVETLRGTVLVGGITLPLPNDPKWTAQAVRLSTNGVSDAEDTKALRHGPVTITRTSVFIGDGPPALTIIDAAAHRYVDAVWTAYHSRVVQEALDKGDSA